MSSILHPVPLRPLSGTGDQAPGPQGHPAGQTADASDGLGRLRAELDRIDDALHDLLMDRATIVAQVAALGVKGAVPIRPGREAAIIRRLLARHTGPLPGMGIVRIWRELMNAMTRIQRPILITVAEAEGGPAFVAAAREHFGALTPLRAHRTAAQAIGEISSGAASAAVLPMPAEGEAPRDAWWTALLHRDDPRIHVVARLPFWSSRPDGAVTVQALVVCATAPDPSGADRSFLGLELPLDVSRARLSTLVAAAGFQPGVTILRRDPGADYAHALVDVDGFVTDGDPRLGALTALLRPPVVLGAYAIPIGDPA